MGLDCLLISTNQVITPYPVYPLGVAHLMGALREAGHQASHFDLLAKGGFEALGEYLRKSPPDLVGLSIRNLDTVDSTAPETYVTRALETMQFVRRHCDCPVVLGGPAFSILPEALMELLGADYGIVGEGELLLPALVEQLAAGEKPVEKIMRSTPSLDPWCSVDYDLSTVDYYLSQGGMMNVQTKRGCPHRCGYCSYPTLEGRKLRFRPPEAVAEDVMRLTQDFGARYIFFADAAFNDSTGHYLEVAEALIRAGNKTPWCAFFRPQGLSEDGLALMKKSGLAAMELGTDAASDTTLAALQKGFTFDEVRKTNEFAAAQKIPCAHFVIFGGPGEDDNTIEEGIRNIDSLPRSVTFAFSGIRILPDTAVYDLALEQGVVAETDSLLEPVFYFSPALDRKRLDQRLREAWKGRLDKLYPAAVMQERIQHLHNRGHVGPMWDFLVR